jgi:hypothetical protein
MISLNMGHSKRDLASSASAPKWTRLRMAEGHYITMSKSLECK